MVWGELLLEQGKAMLGVTFTRVLGSMEGIASKYKDYRFLTRGVTRREAKTDKS